MFKEISIAAILGAASLIPHKLTAQEVYQNSHPLSLAEVWQKVTANKQVIRQQFSVTAAREELKYARDERLPDINIGGEYARVSNMPLYTNGLFKKHDQYPVLHETYSLGAEAAFTVYHGNHNTLDINQKETELTLESLRLAKTESDARLLATTIYLDLQRSEVFRKLLQNTIAEQEKQLRHIDELRKNGVILKSDYLRADLQLSRQKLSLKTINDDISIASQHLDIVIGEPDSLQIVPAAFTEADTTQFLSLNEYIDEALAKAFPARISEEETKISELQIKLAKGTVMPHVELFAKYNYSYPQIAFYPYSADIYGLGMAGVRASFPVSGLFKNGHKVTRAKTLLQQQLIGHAEVVDGIRLKIKAGYLRLKEAVHEVAVAGRNVTQATENARIVKNTYFNQTSLITDLLEADNSLLQTRFELATAQIKVKQQYYQLLNAIGTL